MFKETQSTRNSQLVESMLRSAQSLQSCPTPYNPTDHSPPGSFVHGICFIRVFFFSWSFIFFFCLEQIPLSSHFVWLCVCFCELGKTVPSPGLRKEDSVSWEGRPCMLGGFSGKLELEWARKWGESLFTFPFQIFFLSCVALIQGLSQWLR